jgi:hypothetical protein
VQHRQVLAEILQHGLIGHRERLPRGG